MARINEIKSNLVPIVDGGVASGEGINTTFTSLNNGETFTGTAELNKYSDVMVYVATDQNGVLYAEFSQDGTNWDTSLSFNYDTTRINPPHVLVKGFRFFRVRFTNNSGSNQTYLRLSTYYGSFDKLTSPINSTISENYDAVPTRPTDFHYEVAEGKRQGRTTWNKFGYNDDVDTGTEEIIASFGGAFSKLSGTDTLEIVSTSSNDEITGTGARKIVIVGVDLNWDSLTEEVDLDGVNPVSTNNEFLGVNQVYVSESGSGETNEGSITIKGATQTAVTLAHIPIGEGISQEAIFYVKNNYIALADWLTLNASKASLIASEKLVEIKGWVYNSQTNTKSLVYKKNINTSVNSFTELNPSQPFIINEKSILYFTATSDSNDTIVNLRFSLIESRIS